MALHTGERKVVQEINTGVSDRNLRVSTIDLGDGGKWVDIRDWVPSLGRYGRGAVIPRDKVGELADALDRLRTDDHE